MTPIDLTALLPWIVLGATAVALMLLIAFHRNLALTAGLALIGLAAAFAALLLTAQTGPQQVTSLLIIDAYARFYTGLIIIASFAVGLLSYGYLRRRAEPAEAYYVLLLLATLGSAVLVASSHFASFFLGLEILSVSLYALIAFTRSNGRSIEAGVKYLVLGAASAAFLLFGMALVYAETGTMQFAVLASLPATNAPGSILLQAGLAMLVVGFGFKLALVPFHMWTPDVYEGAPAPTAAFVASASKGGMFAVLLRYFVMAPGYTGGQNGAALPSITIAFAAIAVASMLAGNLLALRQDNVKRILAYSSIAHLGYLLVAFLAGGAAAITAVTFYLVAYFASILAAFGVVAVLSAAEPKRDADALDDYRGLFWRRPWLATILTAALLSLAGIPLTAGFIGKFYVLAAAVGTAWWWLALILVLGSAIGITYYLRIIVAMYREPEGQAGPSGLGPAVAGAGGVALAGLAVAVIWLGLYPAPLLSVIQALVR